MSIEEILRVAFHLIILLAVLYPFVKRVKPVDMRATPDDFTPRITADAEWGQVFVRIGNTPHIICMNEDKALQMKGVRDER